VPIVTPGRAGVSVVIESGSPKSPSTAAREKRQREVVVPGVFQLRDESCNSAFRIQIYQVSSLALCPQHHAWCVTPRILQADKHQFCIESFNGITVGDVRVGSVNGGAGKLHTGYVAAVCFVASCHADQDDIFSL